MAGILFDYIQGELQDSRCYEHLDAIPGKCNRGPVYLYVDCANCNESMDYIPHGELDGEYICPICGRTVLEDDLYSKLNDENEAYLAENDLV